MPERPGPLTVLAEQLKHVLPPSISTLIALLQEHESYGDFLKLVREFLPERENEILRETGPQNQIAKFASYFEDRYFPLARYLGFGDCEEYGDLTACMPLIPLGFGYQDYDDLVQNGNNGAMLMTYFFEQPYGEQGARVALGEGCQAVISRELLERIPEQGYTAADLHKLLDGTPYAALAAWGDIITLSTGNEFLDTDEEMMDNSVMPEWNRANAEYFTREWAQAQEIQRPAYEMAERFEADPEGYFREVTDFIIKQREELNGTTSQQGTDHEYLPVGATR